MKSFYRAYYPALVTNTENKILMHVFVHERLKEVLLHIFELGEPTQNDFKKYANISIVINLASSKTAQCEYYN